jgi:hypothetical protein
MPELLDPAPAAAAGERHGQLASSLPDGGLALTAHKLVEEGARALLIHVPGLVRIDVRPLEDGLQVIPRALIGVRVGWEVDERHLTDYGKVAEENEQPAEVRFRLALWTRPHPLAGRLLLSFTRSREHGPTHFAGHIVLQEFPQDA